MARWELPFALVLLFAASAHLGSSVFVDSPYFNCPATSNFTAGSTYQRNLNALFLNLSSDAASTSGFASATSGQSPDQVQGLVLCRGDLSAADCAKCISKATSQIIQKCPNRKSSILWLDECFLRYSNQNFIGTSDAINKQVLVSGSNISDPARFSPLLGSLMNNLSSEATANPSGRLFAAGEVRFDDFVKIYGLVQCTRDISYLDCKVCLANAISDLPNCCAWMDGARVLTGSCTLRYETAPFFNSTAVAQPPSTVGPRTAAPPPPSDATTGQTKSRSSVVTIISVLIPSGLVLCVLLAVFLVKMKNKRRTTESILTDDSVDQTEDLDRRESLIFDLDSISAATNSFSQANKLGEGGFGPVYKGQLPDGQEIAVKRLSSNSGQGANEFKNEVQLVAKLQHRNLVRLLGCCIKADEKILVYEYVPNGSLDCFLFDSAKRPQLDWVTRMKIINGITRGLLYLHEDSRLMVIHRDLKASNILLDEEMNAKISDFGLAKLVRLDETHGNTSRIAGTYGYMSPEYAMQGLFSIKSDVFSFGVLLLEIVSGQRNASCGAADSSQNLLSYAWRLWRENRATEIVDRELLRSCEMREVVRCIHIGLLCVQEDPARRPPMSSVALMLSSSSFTLALPSTPAFVWDRSIMESNFSSVGSSASKSALLSSSTNDVTISQLDGR